MVSVKERIILFNLVCISVRVALVLLLYFFPIPELIILTGLISLGFLYKYLKPTTIGFFGGKVFWPRLFHFLTYFIASLFLVFKDTREHAYILLAIDVIVGFSLFWNHYLDFSSKKIKIKN